MKRIKLLSILSLGTLMTLTSCGEKEINDDVAIERSVRALQKTTTEAPGLELDFSSEFEIKLKGIGFESSFGGNFDFNGKVNFDHENPQNTKVSLGIEAAIDVNNVVKNEDGTINSEQSSEQKLGINANLYSNMEKMFADATLTGLDEEDLELKGYLSYAELEELFAEEPNTEIVTRKNLLSTEEESELLTAEDLESLLSFIEVEANEKSGELTTSIHASDTTFKNGIRKPIVEQMGSAYENLPEDLKNQLEETIDETYNSFFGVGTTFDIDLDLIVNKEGYLVGLNTDLVAKLFLDEEGTTLEISFSEELAIKNEAVEVNLPNESDYPTNILDILSNVEETEPNA